MTVRFRVTPNMFYRAQRDVMRQIPWMRWSGYFTVVAFPVLMVLLTLAYGGTIIGALRSNAALIVTVVLFWVVGIPLLMRWNAKRLLQSTPAYAGDVSYTFSDAGLDAQSAVGNSHLAWSAFTRAAETRDFFLLFQNRATALFVPKAAISSQADTEALTRLIEVRVTSGAARPGSVDVAAI